MDEITEEMKNILNAQAMFKAQMKNARDYITNERTLGFFPERFSQISKTPDENSLSIMKQHPFVRWLHQQISFQQAKKKTVDWSLAVIKSAPDGIIGRYTAAHK